jgi:hypothetical protein
LGEAFRETKETSKNYSCFGRDGRFEYIIFLEKYIFGNKIFQQK